MNCTAPKSNFRWKKKLDPYGDTHQFESRPCSQPQYFLHCNNIPYLIWQLSGMRDEHTDYNRTLLAITSHPSFLPCSHASERVVFSFIVPSFSSLGGKMPYRARANMPE